MINQIKVEKIWHPFEFINILTSLSDIIKTRKSAYIKYFGICLEKGGYKWLICRESH